MLPKAKTWITLLLTLGFFALLMQEVARDPPLNGARKTEPIRQNLERLRKVLLTAQRHLDDVHVVNESEQIVLMQSAVGIFKDYLLPHLAAEEEVLYPAAERLIPGSAAGLTEALRKEHEIMRRWIGEMERLAEEPMPDHNAFTRRGERLLGLIEAHFEVDEAVLLKILDQPSPLTRGEGRDSSYVRSISR
jgi:hemerythrin-like domain-containing protein